jgi:hypothetical protein
VVLEAACGEALCLIHLHRQLSTEKQAQTMSAHRQHTVGLLSLINGRWLIPWVRIF